MTASLSTRPPQRKAARSSVGWMSKATLVPWFGKPTIQKTPRIAPMNKAKKIVNPYPVAGSQKAKQETPHVIVNIAATSTRLKLSLQIPMIGRPTAVPTFSAPMTSVDCERDKPMAMAKSPKEYSSTTYPSMLMKAHDSSNQTSSRTSRRVSMANCGGLICLLRSRMSALAIELATNPMKHVIRNAQATESCSIILPVAQAKTAPPIPDPAAMMPFARLRFLENHCERIAVLGMYKNPVPNPIRTPCERYNCQICFDTEAVAKPVAWKMTPSAIVRCLPYSRVKMVTRGDTIIAAEKLKPPMKA